MEIANNNVFKEKILEYLKNARFNYNEICKKPERYRKEHEFEKAQAVLLNIECLCFELGLIEHGTI